MIWSVRAGRRGLRRGERRLLVQARVETPSGSEPGSQCTSPTACRNATSRPGSSRCRTVPSTSSRSRRVDVEQHRPGQLDGRREPVAGLDERAGQQRREPGGVAAGADRPRGASRCPSRPPGGPARPAGPGGAATTSRATVAWPCPCGTVPSSTRTTPCGSTLIRTCSVEPDLPAPAGALLGGRGEPDVADVGPGRVDDRRDPDAEPLAAGPRLGLLAPAARRTGRCPARARTPGGSPRSRRRRRSARRTGRRRGR